ncbi:MAG: hypothetical protein KME17_01975 [Cyanosarcina radialis HA8281-LM2]|jgi:hypothetical protein|nr:hypothetical protein [Cyanosarcina radialis HA8281-LM2]
MTQTAQLPDPEKIQQGAQKLHEACKMLDALNVLLDEAIAQVEAENRRSPLYRYRLERAKKLLDARSEKQNV